MVLTVLTALAALLPSCSSRLKLSLFVTAEQTQRKVRIESTEYIAEAKIGDPLADKKIVNGEGNLIVVSVSTRGGANDAESDRLLRFDEDLRMRLYVNLPALIQPEQINLATNSIVHVLGRYDQTAESKVYYAQDGTCTIDSLVKSRLFITVEGTYRNNFDAEINFDGKFKMKYTP